MALAVVSLGGQGCKSGMGLGLLSYLGRPEWLAATPADYLRIAGALAADRQPLNRLRLGLRAEVELSALMRGGLFNHHFGECLRAMWLLWLARAKHPDDAQAQAQALDD